MPRHDTLGYTMESRPRMEPGFRTELHPISALSPINPPNFRKPVSMGVPSKFTQTF